ncbi:MAG: ROK family protein [Cytophagales bacterium]|nr:ROK family protein [Cytophagales bacterium]
MHILGIDIGGSGIKGAIVDIANGSFVTDRHRIDTPLPATTTAVADTVLSMTNHFDWKGKIGCGFPAVIQHGVAKTASNIDESWINTNVEKLLLQTTQCPTYVINDADAAGLAEMKYGEGKDAQGLILLLTIGTGIGSALFNNGKLVPNTEFGHLYYKDLVAEKYVSDSARKKYELEWDEWAKRFNNYLKHLERTINPDLFIIGGGVSKKSDKYLSYLHIDTPLKIAALQNDAGIIGAALAAIV